MMHAMGDRGVDADSRGGHPVGTKADFLAFYRLAVGPVNRSASRLVGGHRQRCEDLVQEAFLDLVREIRAGRISAVDIGWMIVAVRHRFIDSLRRGEREARKLELVWSQQQQQPAISIYVELSNERATQLLAKLPDAQRAALVLHHVDGLSVAEVAVFHLGRHGINETAMPYVGADGQPSGATLDLDDVVSMCTGDGIGTYTRLGRSWSVKVVYPADVPPASGCDHMDPVPNWERGPKGTVVLVRHAPQPSGDILQGVSILGDNITSYDTDWNYVGSTDDALIFSKLDQDSIDIARLQI
jgi:RNA polymerase sigma-70 factor, ECF subfamily